MILHEVELSLWVFKLYLTTASSNPKSVLLQDTTPQSAPWVTTPDSTSDKEAQIKECGKIQAETMLLALKWNLIIRNDDSSNKGALWGSMSAVVTLSREDDAAP